MAGIGFELRRLMRKDGLWSLIESQLHGLVAVAGPWFFTIIAMALPALLFSADAHKATTGAFVTLLMYTFSVSLTVTSPIAIALTRHVSDCLYAERTDEVTAAFLSALLLALLSMVPVWVAGTLWLDLPLDTRLHALLAYALVTLNWIAGPMLSTIRQFRALTGAFALGTVVFGLVLRQDADPDMNRLFFGFNLGMGVTNTLVCALILHNFPGKSWPLTAIWGALGRYWELALGGLFYGAGIWVDKWIMWQAPEHQEVRGGLWTYPTYDTVVFIAYVTTIPALSFFVIQAETSLHEACARLYASIQKHGSRDRLIEAQEAIVQTFFSTGRDVLFLQVCVTGLILAIPTLLLDTLGVASTGVFMFRFCAMGAAFQSGVLMLTIVLYYFDSRRTVLWVNLLYLLSNAGFTWLCQWLGLRWYGMGYLLAGATTFAVAYIHVQITFRDALFLAFVRQNGAVAREVDSPIAHTELFSVTLGSGPTGWRS